MFFQKCCFRGATATGQIATRQIAVSQKIDELSLPYNLAKLKQQNFQANVTWLFDTRQMEQHTLKKM